MLNKEHLFIFFIHLTFFNRWGHMLRKVLPRSTPNGTRQLESVLNMIQTMLWDTPCIKNLRNGWTPSTLNWNLKWRCSPSRLWLYKEIKQVLFQYQKLWIFEARKYGPDWCPVFEEKVIRFANSTSARTVKWSSYN